VGVRFGPAARQRTLRDPVRLTPFPSRWYPGVVYLGELKGGRAAAFLIAPEIRVAGDGSCRPSASHCEILELKAGDTEFLDVLTPTVGLVQYELNVTRITAHRSRSAAAAARAHRRESKTGREVVRKSPSKALTELSFSYLLGALVRRPAPQHAAPPVAPPSSVTPR
jgi:hypothetical protein